MQTAEQREKELAGPRTVFVPTRESAIGTTIKPGSGIVGEVREDRNLLLYYEGNLYRAANLKTFADLVSHAAGRMAVRYPTDAVVIAEPTEAVAVGTYYPSEGKVVVQDRAALAAWLGVAEVPEAELLTTEGQGFKRRTLSAMLEKLDTLTPEARAWAEREARQLGLR